jgi:DNA invertase Pin-like site-specific DNA recombinase
MTTCAAIYARASPDCPLPADEQIEQLRTGARQRGWAVDHVFTDRPTSVKGPDRRPGETALINAIRDGAINRVLVWSVCRIGKSLADLVGFLEVCRSADVSLWLEQQDIDTEKSDILLDVASMMALHLRQARRDRILRGQAAARALSIRFGRPPIAKAKVEKARIALAAGKGVRQAARLAGISAASASRLKSTLGTISASV